jgi:Domain of unknown function (DUF4249)
MRTLIILFSVLLTACEVTIDRPLPPHESKLVLHAFTRPDDSLRLSLTRSYGPLENVTVNDLLVDDATVRMWFNGVEQTPVDYRDTIMDPFFGTRSGYYLPRAAVPKEGDRVTIEVSHPEYGTARGETVLPMRATLVKVEIIQDAFRQVRGEGSGQPYTQSILRLTINDPAGNENRYRIDFLRMLTVDPALPGFLIPEVVQVYGVATPSSDGGFETTSEYADDEGKDGQQMVVDFLCELPNAYVELAQWQAYDIDSVEVYFTNANRDFAEYQEKLRLQRDANNGGISLTPAEPVELYDNIDGGFGVVGGFLQQIENLKID